VFNMEFASKVVDFRTVTGQGHLRVRTLLLVTLPRDPIRQHARLASTAVPIILGR